MDEAPMPFDDDAPLPPSLRQAAETLRRAPSDLDAGLDARVMAEIRRSPGVWSRLVRPRVIRLSPLVSLAAAAAIGALIFWTGRRTASMPAPVAVAEAAADAHAVQFVFVAPQAATVSVVGDFNEWREDRTPLRRNGDVWTATVPMSAGRHEYAFVVDGDWHVDPRAPQSVADDFGRPNSVVRVGT